MTDVEPRLRSLEDDRLVMLTRMDTLATKADLQALRGEIHAIENGLIKWLVGVCLTILLFVVGFGLTLVNIALQILSRLPEQH
jgi:hypothetical protein